VIDASVLGAVFFQEEESEVARRFLAVDRHLAAPDLLFVEMAGLAAKKVRRKVATAEVGRRALTAIGEFVVDVRPASGLAGRAFELAAEHGVSAYDGLYLALAVALRVRVVTLDGKLVRSAEAAGLGRLVSTPV